MNEPLAQSSAQAVSDLGVGTESALVLMYHGVFDDQTRDRIDPEDRPYALHVKDFEQQLVALKHHCDVISAESFGQVASGAAALANSATSMEGLPEHVNAAGTGAQARVQKPRVLVTFDDGHLSNFDLAAPLLMQHGLPALFFVTADFIARREHFCDWHQLRELHAAGFRVGGHGLSHQFFPTLSSAQRRQELTVSKALIEENVGAPCTHMSFPGGRYEPEDLELAKAAGYEAVHTSDEGELSERVEGLWRIPRVAMRDQQALPWFERLIQRESSVLQSLRRRRRLKSTAQKLVGHRVYHALYAAKQGR